MKVKYIRRDIPEEISEEGGAFVQLVGKNTVGLTASIKEAIRMLYCVGEASLIEGYFFGLCRSVFAGIKEDGCARCIGDIRFYPVCGGTFDLEKGWDPLVNDVRIKAQLVNGVELDVTDWEFEDATEGRVAFSIDSISNGTTAGVVSNDANTEINGKNFPETLEVSWVCGTKSGTVSAAHLTRKVSRLTILPAALASLTAAESGQDITFTVKGAYNKVSKTAKFVHVGTTITQVTDGDGVAGQAKKDKGITIDGTIFPTSADQLKVATNKLRTLAEDGSEVSSVGFDILGSDGAFVSNSATQIKFNELIWTPLTCTGASKFEVTINGTTKLVALVSA